MEQGPFDIIRTVKEAVAPLIDKYEIAAVGFDNQGETFIVWDNETSQACSNTGEMKCSFGTGSFLLMNISSLPCLSNNRLLTTVDWNFDGHRACAFDGGIFVTARPSNG